MHGRSRGWGGECLSELHGCALTCRYMASSSLLRGLSCGRPIPLDIVSSLPSTHRADCAASKKPLSCVRISAGTPICRGEQVPPAGDSAREAYKYIHRRAHRGECVKERLPVEPVIRPLEAEVRDEGGSRARVVLDEVLDDVAHNEGGVLGVAGLVLLGAYTQGGAMLG